MKEKTKELADSVGAVYPTLLLGRHDGVLFTETELETFVELVAAAELRRLHEVNADLLIAMQKIAASSADEFGSYYTNRGNIAAARAAIAKAEGEMK